MESESNNGTPQKPIIDAQTAKNFLSELTNQFFKRNINPQVNIPGREIMFDQNDNLIFFSPAINGQQQNFTIMNYSPDLLKITISTPKNPFYGENVRLDFIRSYHNPLNKIFFGYYAPQYFKVDFKNLDQDVFPISNPKTTKVVEIFGTVGREAMCRTKQVALAKIDLKLRTRIIIKYQNYLQNCTVIGKDRFALDFGPEHQIVDSRTKKILFRRKTDSNRRFNLKGSGFGLVFKKEENRMGYLIQRISSRKEEKICKIFEDGTTEEKYCTIQTFYKEKYKLNPKFIFFGAFTSFRNNENYSKIYKISTSKMEVVSTWKIDLCVYAAPQNVRCPPTLAFRNFSEDGVFLYSYTKSNFKLRRYRLEDHSPCALLETIKKHISERPSHRSQVEDELELLVVKENTGFLKIYSMKNGELLKILKFTDLSNNNKLCPTKHITKFLSKDHLILLANNNKKLINYSLASNTILASANFEDQIVDLVMIRPKKMILVRFSNFYILLNHNLSTISNYNYDEGDEINGYRKINIFYIKNLNLLVYSRLIELHDNTLNICVKIFSGDLFDQKQTQYIMEDANTNFINYAEQNKVLLMNQLAWNHLTGIDLKTNTIIDIFVDVMSNSPLYILYEKEDVVVLGMDKTNRTFEVNLKNGTFEELQGINWILNDSYIHVPKKKVVYSYKREESVLKCYNAEDSHSFLRLELEKIRPYNGEEGKELVRWMRCWVDAVYTKDELNQFSHLLLCLAFLNNVEAVKLGLELFGYPIYSKSEIEKEDLYYKIFDSDIIKDEVKEVILEHLVKERRVSIYNDEQKKKLGL